MDWLNLHTQILDSPEVVGAEPTDRGTWLMLQRYCIGQENGGVIRDCRNWKDRKWQQLARVTLAEVNRESELWNWDRNDLIITHYPVDKQEIVLRKREIAKQNGKRGGRPVGSEQEPTLEPISVISEKAEGVSTSTSTSTFESSSAKSDLPGIVSLYPKRERQAEAVEALAAHVRKGTDLDAVASGTRAIAAVIARLPGGHLNAFVPSAAMFFRNRRWEDDPNTWLRNSGKHTNGAPQQTLDLGGRRPAANSRTIECE